MRFNSIPGKIPTGFLYRNWQADFKTYVKKQKKKSTYNSQSPFKKNSKYTIWFQDLLKSYSNQDKGTQRSMEENPETDPYIYGQLKETSEKNSVGTTGYPSRKKKNNTSHNTQN